MGLITINGVNPFSGQSDPYISLSSNISYEGGEGDIKNTYTLNGAITGCNKQALIDLQTGLAYSFDWERDATIPQNIKISGVIEASPTSQIVPVSLNFDSSNYIGAINYTLTLELFTGLLRPTEEEENLIEKAHTETTNIDENECVSISTNISCQPNQNLTGCGAIEAANRWISGQLGKTKLGEITRTKNLPLNSESLTINPITSSVSYSSQHGQDCDDITEAGAPHTGFQMAYCTESDLEDNNCVSGNSITKYNGEVYKSGAIESDLIQYLNDNLLTGFPNHNNLSIDYTNSQDSIVFSFDSLSNVNGLVYEPRDLLIDDYTTTIDINHENSSKSYSVDGTISILNKTYESNNTVLEMTTSEVLNRAKDHINGEGPLSSISINRNDQEGTLSYSAKFSDGNNPDENESGISNRSVSYTPSLYQYTVRHTLECEYAISKSRCPNRGSVSASVTAISGSGYDYLSSAQDEATRLISTFGGEREEDEDVDYASDKSSVTVTKSYSFKGTPFN
jgi:hypothetical protein